MTYQIHQHLNENIYIYFFIYHLLSVGNAGAESVLRQKSGQPRLSCFSVFIAVSYLGSLEKSSKYHELSPFV